MVVISFILITLMYDFVGGGGGGHCKKKLDVSPFQGSKG